MKKERSDGVIKHYQGEIEYAGAQIEAIYHSEGRATPNGGQYRYEYSLRDHLGNTRVTFADLDGSGTVDTSEILQENHYYPFGMLMEGSWGQSGANQYQYNGKELNEDFGLEWLDYGARWYEAAIGRWHAIDPLVEKYYRSSPYAYVENNPISFYDPDGMQKDDDYIFSATGEFIQKIENDQPDRIIVQTEKYYDSESGEVKQAEDVYSMDSDLGHMVRTVFAEMGGEDATSMKVVAESIKNRTDLPDNVYEHEDSYQDAVEKFYDVTNPSDPANPRYSDTEGTKKDNPIEDEAFKTAASVSIQTHYGSAPEIGKGVIFYNSSSSTIYDSNSQMQKIKLDTPASGIKGAWKLKKH